MGWSLHHRWDADESVSPSSEDCARSMALAGGAAYEEVPDAAPPGEEGQPVKWPLAREALQTRIASRKKSGCKPIPTLPRILQACFSGVSHWCLLCEEFSSLYEEAPMTLFVNCLLHHFLRHYRALAKSPRSCVAGVLISPWSWWQWRLQGARLQADQRSRQTFINSSGSAKRR